MRDRLIKPRLSFTQVPNALICSTEITCKAKAVYCYLMSRPENWNFYMDEIVSNMKESSNTVKGAIKELIKFGWIDRIRLRDSKGRLKNFEYHIYYEVSSTDQKTTDGETTDGKTTDGKLTPTNTNYTNTEKTNTNSTSRERISFKDFRDKFIKDFKDIKFKLGSCPGWNKETYFSITNQGYIFNEKANKLLKKEDSYGIWDYLYTEELKKMEN